ncbi:MAG: tyrosine-type recombinase/integrase, partial [Candidatus Sulfotelmatobacter sp.]
RLEHIYWQDAFYFNPSDKTRKARRYVPLSERLIARLRRFSRNNQDGPKAWLFASKKSRSGHIELSGLEHRFRKIARKLGIPDALKLYCARHTFGTVAMAETRDPGLVKEVMGAREPHDDDGISASGHGRDQGSDPSAKPTEGQ